MTKERAIEEAYMLGSTDTAFTHIISSFSSKEDIEIAASFGAWLSNGSRGETSAFEGLVYDIMNHDPSGYIRSYQEDNSFSSHPNGCFFRVLTNGNAHSMLLKARTIWCENNGLEDVLNDMMSRKRLRNKPAYTVLGKIFGCEAGFPSKKSTGTYYRLNLLIYWLSYKVKVWDMDAAQLGALLPCNDEIFERAYTLGIVKKKMNTTLRNTYELTQKARLWFGDKDFYKMYELLNFF